MDKARRKACKVNEFEARDLEFGLDVFVRQFFFRHAVENRRIATLLDHAHHGGRREKGNENEQ